MGLETGTYISSLVATNPVVGDNKTEGDDHLRLIKSTVLATFPNITGAVTPIQGELNRLTGHTATAQGFYAYLVTTQTSGNTLVCDTELYDHGGVYSAVAGGVFTASITGDWLVSFTVGVTNSSGSTGVIMPRLIANGNTSAYYCEVGQTILTGAQATIGWSGVLNLTAGTYLQINNVLGTSIAVGFGWGGTSHCSFSARLLV